MWIEPNSTVKILQNVPLDVRHNNTLWFNSKSEQSAYFSSCVKRRPSGLGGGTYTFEKVSYQRIERNYIRIEANAGELYDCNYLMFKNTSFENKWFYAFITNVEYIANRVAQIEYTIDALQTWFWDCDFAESFVVRQHPVWDDFGANRIPEEVAPCDYVYASFGSTGWFDVQALVVETSTCYEKTQGGSEFIPNAPVDMLGNVAQGVNFTYFKFRFNDSTVSDNTGIPVYTRKQAVEKAYEYVDATISMSGENAEQRLIGMFQCPAAFLTTYTAHQTDYTGEPPYSLKSQVVEPFSKNTSIARPATLGTYGEPHNRKLLQFPYNFLYLTDCRQNEMGYKYEDFIKSDGQLENPQALTLNIKGVISSDPSMLIVPKNYNGADYDISSKFVIKGYPQCSINADMWKAYVANNGGILPTVAGGLIAPLAGGASSGLGIVQNYNSANQSAANQFAKAHTKTGKIRKGMESAPSDYAAALLGNTAMTAAAGVSLAAKTASAIGAFNANMGQAPAVSGNANGDVIYSAGYYDFYYGQKCIKPELAKIVDDYFDMYGYLTNQLTRPNLASRPHWNYIQVMDANLLGNIPQDDLEELKGIFENGITFWKHADEVGKYEYDNWSDAHR